jgi:hypothetical protein
MSQMKKVRDYPIKLCTINSYGLFINLTPGLLPYEGYTLPISLEN